MKNKFLKIVSGLIAMVALGTSCEKGPQFREFNYATPVPSGLSPASGYPMINVTITGTNFDTLKGAVKVWFGGIQATNVVSATGNQIVVQVPAGAVSGKVSLQVWTHTVDSIGTYTVLPLPVLTSVASNGPFGSSVAAKGDTVTIKGTGFGTDASKLAVSFNGTEATILSPVQDTTFKVIAPEGYASGYVYITIGGLTLKGPALLNPDAKGDVTVFYIKNYQQPFASTEASGTGRWRDPTDWIVTSPAKNHSSYGGWDSDDGTVLAIESGWGAADVIGGLIYQTVTLPAGNYTFSASLGKNGFDINTAYIVAAVGTSLPTVTPTLSNSLGFAELHNATFNFTLTEQTQVSLGFVVVSMTGNKYWRVTTVKLVSY